MAEQKTAKALGETNKGETTRENNSAENFMITNDPTSTGGMSIPVKK